MDLASNLTTRAKQYSIGQVFGFTDVPDSITALGCDSNDGPVPEKSNTYGFRREFLRELLEFLREPSGDGFYVVGPTGSGKSSGVTETLARLNWPCQEVTAHGRLEFDDLVGQFKLVSVAPGEPPVMQFVYGVLANAMKHGHVLLINEVDYVDPAENGGFNDIIEGKSLTITANGGEIIRPHPMFRIIFTANSNGCGDTTGLHRGVLAQNIAFLDRCRMTHVAYMDAQEEDKLLASKVPNMPQKLRVKLIEVANAIRKQFLGESGTGEDGKLAVTMSTRTLFRWAKLAMDFRQHPTPLKYSMEMSLTLRADVSDALAIEKIASGILGEQWNPTNT